MDQCTNDNKEEEMRLITSPATTSTTLGSTSARKRRATREETLQHKRKLQKTLIARANKVTGADLLNTTSYTSKGLCFKVECHAADQVSKEMMEWMFQLLKENMQHHYQSAYGPWDDSNKRAELQDPAARYLIALDTATDEPVAFSHFRFDIEDNREVLYWYVIKLPTYRALAMKYN